MAKSSNNENKEVNGWVLVSKGRCDNDKGLPVVNYLSENFFVEIYDSINVDLIEGVLEKGPCALPSKCIKELSRIVHQDHL